MVRWKCNQGVRQELDLTTYRAAPCIPVRPRCLRFPLGLNIQTSLATSYWFSIPLNIALLLIEFTHHYQCLKESCPPLPAPPRCSLFSRRHISNFPCRSSTSDSSLRRADMEIDYTGENGICDSSMWDKHQEQQRWVTSCSTFCPFSSALLQALTSYLWSCPPPVCRHHITVGLSVQVKERKFSLQAQKYVIATIECNCRDSCGTETWAMEYNHIRIKQNNSKSGNTGIFLRT